MVKDMEDIPMRLTLGDTSYRVLGQQRAFLTTGLTIESNFNLQPYNRFFPTASRDFFLDNASWVTVRINGRFYSRIRLRAGRHSLQELPILVGLNYISIEVEEDNGRRRIINFTETGSVNVYKEGTNFFSYTLGSSDIALSDRYQQVSNNFNSIFSFYHLYGVTDYFTFGGYGQIAQEEKLFALVGNWRSSFINGDFTLARGMEEDVSNGNFAELSFNQTYWSNKKRRAFTVRGSYAESGYQRLGEDPLNEQQITASFDFDWQHAQGYFSTVGGRWQSTNRFVNDEDYIAFYQFSRNTPSWNLQLRFEQSRIDDFSFELNFNYFWGKTKNVVSQYQYLSQNEQHLARTTYSSPYINRSIQLDAQAIKSETGESQQFDADYTHERFIASADFSRTNSDTTESREIANLKVASSISFVDGKWGWSRPITQAFAILSKDDTKDDVIVNPTGKDKVFETVITNNLNGVLTQLNPYNSQDIYIESEEGASLRFEENKKTIVPAYKSGYLFNFVAKGDKLAKGQLIHNGKVVSQNVFTFWSVDKTVEEVSFADEDGRFWVDGLKPGKYYIQWYDKKSAPFEVKGDTFSTDLGKINLNLEAE